MSTVNPFGRNPSGLPTPGAEDVEQLRIGAALGHIQDRGNLDDFPADRNERRALMVTAVRRGLVAWDRRHERYELTGAGKAHLEGFPPRAKDAPAAPADAGPQRVAQQPSVAHKEISQPPTRPPAVIEGRNTRRRMAIAAIVLLAACSGVAAGALLESSKGPSMGSPNSAGPAHTSAGGPTDGASPKGPAADQASQGSPAGSSGSSAAALGGAGAAVAIGPSDQGASPGTQDAPPGTLAGGGQSNSSAASAPASHGPTPTRTQHAPGSPPSTATTAMAQGEDLHAKGRQSRSAGSRPGIASETVRHADAQTNAEEQGRTKHSGDDAGEKTADHPDRAPTAGEAEHAAAEAANMPAQAPEAPKAAEAKPKSDRHLRRLDRYARSHRPRVASDDSQPEGRVDWLRRQEWSDRHRGGIDDNDHDRLSYADEDGRPPVEVGRSYRVYREDAPTVVVRRPFREREAMGPGGPFNVFGWLFH